MNITLNEDKFIELLTEEFASFGACCILDSDYRNNLQKEAEIIAEKFFYYIKSLEKEELHGARNPDNGQNMSLERIRR